MSEVTVHLTMIKNKADAKSEQKKAGGYVFPVGTILVSKCTETGESCGVEPLVPNAGKTASEQLSDWMDTNVVSELEQALKDGK